MAPITSRHLFNKKPRGKLTLGMAQVVGDPPSTQTSKSIMDNSRQNMTGWNPLVAIKIISMNLYGFFIFFKLLKYVIYAFCVI